MNLNLTLVPITCPLSLLGLLSDGQCPFTVPRWALGWGGGSGRPGAQTWEENSQDRIMGTGQPRGGRKRNCHLAFCRGLVLSSSILTWTSVPFTLTFTSSAYLLPAFKGSNKQLLEGPQEQQHKSHLPGLPPQGMSTGGAECDEKPAGGRRRPPSLEVMDGCALVCATRYLVSGPLITELLEARSLSSLPTHPRLHFSKLPATRGFLVHHLNLYCPCHSPSLCPQVPCDFESGHLGPPCR